jgi:hypothetical protein
LCFFIVFGLFTEDPSSYYTVLGLLYSVSIFNNYLKQTNNVLCNHPTIKIFLIIFLNSVQGFLLGTLVTGIISNIFSFIKNVLGYILKMNYPDNNHPKNNNDPNHNNRNDPNNNNNGNGPNNSGDMLTTNREDSDSDSDQDYREVAYSKNYVKKNSSTEHGEGIETNFDYNDRKISKVH